MNGADYANPSNEAVALTHDRLDKTWFRGIIAQGRPHFPDDVIYVSLGINEKAGLPQPCYDIFTRHQLFAAACEENENLHRLLLNFHSPAASPQLIAAQVELNVR